MLQPFHKIIILVIRGIGLLAHRVVLRKPPGFDAPDGISELHQYGRPAAFHHVAREEDHSEAREEELDLAHVAFSEDGVARIDFSEEGVRDARELAGVPREALVAIPVPEVDFFLGWERKGGVFREGFVEPARSGFLGADAEEGEVYAQFRMVSTVFFSGSR